MDNPNPITAPAPSANGNGRKMRTPPDVVTWLQGATLTETEAARRASKTAWKPDATGPAELLPAPAGEDEARMGRPEYCGPALAPADGGAASTKPISRPRRQPRPCLTCWRRFVPREFVRLCGLERQIADLIAERAAGRLACILEESTWLAWRAGAGWRPVDTPALLAAAMLADLENTGLVDRDGVQRMRPQTGGRAATAAGVLRALPGLPGIGTHTADWDSDPALVGLPSGEILNLTTGERRAPQREDRIRRRLGAMPATDAEYRENHDDLRHPEKCIDCGGLRPTHTVEGGAVCDDCKARRVEKYGDDWQRDRRPRSPLHRD